MKKHYKVFMLATVVTALTSGIAFNAFAQPPILPTYVEIVEFRNATGAVIGVKYISHGCADPQPLGWGVTSGRGTIISTQICFAGGPGPGGPW